MIDLVKSFGIERPIIAVRPVVHIVSDAFQVPGGYHRTPPHQDWRSVQGSIDALVVWLPLVEVSQSLARSKCCPAAIGVASLKRGRIRSAMSMNPNSKKMNLFPLPLSRAMPLFFRCSRHRTGKEQRPGIRWAVSLRYNNAVASEFVEHRYPNPFVYHSQDALLVEGYPTLQDIHQVFDPE